jgi:hypothetical protein
VTGSPQVQTPSFLAGSASTFSFKSLQIPGSHRMHRCLTRPLRLLLFGVCIRHRPRLRDAAPEVQSRLRMRRSNGDTRCGRRPGHQYAGQISEEDASSEYQPPRATPTQCTDTRAGCPTQTLDVDARGPLCDVRKLTHSINDSSRSHLRMSAGTIT